jgi:oxygen-dependent protoporphyrinogen oxidase
MLARTKSRRAAKKEVEKKRARGEAVEDLVESGGPAGPGGTLTSFRRGLDVFPERLAAELGDSLRFGSQAVAIERGGSGQPSRPWIVHVTEGDPIPADAVVVAVPSPRAAPFLRTLDKDLAGTVGEIRTAGLAVVAIAFDAVALGGAPEGFGFLVPRGTGPRILGCLWDSSIFPGRAPEGKTLFRAMIGGAHDPDAVAESEEALVTQVREDLRTTMGLTAPPIFTRVYRWPLGIGQYTVGHQDRLDRIHARLEARPGLWVAGSSFYGISMNACIEKAEEQAGAILSFLAET